MDEKYRRLYDELLFTRQLLGIGLTSLRKANFENKGVYFQAFTNLSLGLERLCKVCLLLNYYHENGKFPSTREISKNGHNLEKLVNSLLAISENESLSDIHGKILQHFSNFAESRGRYSNINYLTEGSQIDPISAWKKIDDDIESYFLTSKQKTKIAENKMFSQYNNQPILILGFEDENRMPIDNGNLLFERLISFEFICGYRTLLVIQIIEVIYNILKKINDSNLGKNYFIQDLGYIFATFFYGSDSDKRNRKNFIRMS